MFMDYIGKGNTGVASAKDSRAIFYNPALILMNKETTLGLDITYGNSKTVNQLYGEGMDYVTGITDRIEAKILAIDPFSSANITENALGYFTVNGPLSLSLKLNNWQFSLFHYTLIKFYLSVNVDYSPPVFTDNTDVGVLGIDDLGFNVGFAFPLPIQFVGSKWEYFYWGFSAKFFQRVKGIKNFTDIQSLIDTDPALIMSDISPARAVGVTTDMGFYYTFQNFGMGLSFYNVLSTPLTYYPVEFPVIWKSSSDTEVTAYRDTLSREIAFGFSYLMPHISTVPRQFLRDWSISLEGNDLLNQDDYPELLQKIRLGTEITVADTIRVRAGLYHKSFTFGMGFTIFMVSIDSAYWQEKIGNDTATNWGMRLAIEF